MRSWRTTGIGDMGLREQRLNTVESYWRLTVYKSCRCLVLTTLNVPSVSMLSPGLRGGFVVALGLIAGFVVLSHVRPVHRAEASSGPHPTTTVQRLSPITTAAVASVAHDPSSVPVLLLNGVNVNKPIAGSGATTLAAAGYTNSTPKDAATTVPTSTVYFQSGYEADAAAVAAVLGLPAGEVQPLPSPPPPAIANAGGAPVIVVVGPDAPAAQGA